MMRALQTILLALSSAAAAENLLTNPSFDTLKGGQPAGWNLYVQPQTGSWGRLDEEAPHDGKYSACLHIATPYIVEPLNNWSQNIVKDLRGADVVVRGFIKTEDATEAAIWLQCFQKSPLATLDAVTSSDVTPVRGTQDWTPVEMKMKIPAGTEFVVCRCVLKGSGTAWFDDLCVETAAPEASAEPRKEPSEPAPGADAKSPLRNPIAAPTEVGKSAPPSKAKPAPKPSDDKPKTYDELLESNRALRKSNQDLQEQVKKLNEQVQSLRQLIQRGTPLGLNPMGAIPPLTPRGLGADEGF